MEYITLKEKTGLKRFGIKTQDGEDTGEYIEIDLEDIELPIKANECQARHFENYKKLKNSLEEAKQKSDEVAENEIFSEKQKATFEAYNEFYKAEEEALDLVLGKGATRKLLGGRKPYLMMYDDINGYLEQILPTMEETQKKLEQKIREKYQTKKEDDIL